MTTSRRLAPLPLMLIGLAALCAALVLIPWVVQAQSQGVTPTAAATGTTPPAQPTNLQASAEHDEVALTWTASTDQTVTHYAILRRNPETDPSQVFHVIESNAGAETSYNDSSVSASSTYIYRVKAVSPTGVSQWSGFVKADTPSAPVTTPEPTSTPTPTPDPTPAPADLRPTGLEVELVENKVTLSWTAPAEDADSVDGYEILRRRPMEGETTLATLVVDTESTATTYTDATANEAGVRYVYRVKALRGDDVSLSSNFDRIDLPADYVPDPTPTPEPESTPDDQAPTGLTAWLADGGGVALSWAAPAEDADSVTGYEVLRAAGEGEMSTLAADTASTTTTYTDTTATEAGETYAYQVKAIRGEERSQASGQAQVEIPHDPVDLAPTGLTAVVLTASLVVVGEDSTPTITSVSLRWTSPAEDADSVTGYEILRAVGDGEIATLVADTGNTATAYTDASATQTGETYAYTVKAIRGEDRSQASGQAQAQIPHDPVDLAPSDLTAEAVDGGGVSLSWSAPAEDADSVTGYEVLRAVGDGEMATLAADTASTTTTYSDATATEEGETYAYRVKAIRGQARSQASNRVALIPVEPPATPENLKPTNLTFEIREDGVTLAWDVPAAAADSVTGYRVVRRRPNQGENEWLVWKWDTGSTETTYRDGYARTHGEYYMYRVRALRGDDYSKMSNRVDVRRPEATPQTAEWAPSNLVAQMYFEVTLGEEGVTTQVKLTWDAPAEGTEWVRGYEVQRATCDDDFVTLAPDTGSTDTSYADATAEAGESYTYRVRARRPQGPSLWSGTQTLLVPGGNGESDCAVPFVALPSQVQDPQTGLTPATLLNTLLGYDEAEGTGTLAPNELVFGEDGTFRVTSVNTWPGIAGLVLYLTAGTSTQDAAFADRDFVLEAKETVLVVGTTEFSFDDAVLSHSDTTGDNAEYTGVVIATWTEGQAGLVASETVDFRLLLRNRPDEAQFSQHDTEVVLVKNTGQTADDTVYLTTSRPSNEYAQGFLTGSNPGGYRLTSISFDFGTIETPADAGSELTVKLFDEGRRPHIDFPEGPGSALCTLSDPDSFSTAGVHTFNVPETCPALKPATHYFAVIQRVASTGGGINLNITSSSEEDSGRATDWLIQDSRSWKHNNGLWVAPRPGLGSHLIEVRGVLLDSEGQYPTNEYFLTLPAAGNREPAGLWSDGTTIWVSDIEDSKIYAYDMGTKARKSAEDFTLASGNSAPAGIWSDGAIMWVANHEGSKVYAYDMTTKDRVRSKEFPVPTMVGRKPGLGFAAGLTEAGFWGMWSDGSGIMWLLATGTHSAYAYRIDTGDAVQSKDLFVGLPYLQGPAGIWGDDQTIWLSDMEKEPARLLAFWRYDGSPQSGRDLRLHPDNSRPLAMWSDGETIWVTDNADDRIFAYALPAKENPLNYRDRVTVERVTDTTAVVAVNLADLPFNGQRKHVSISINRAGYAIYAHPDAKTARFMLRGLQPETQYTVSGKFDIQPSHFVGRKVFRTDYARLDRIDASDLTHTEATVTVSLMHADVNKRAYPSLWLSSDRTEPERTYYLRHRPSDETDWSEPVELTFSGPTTDVRLTGLDPGTDYDVVLAEDEEFTTQTASSEGYTGTLTVGEDFGFLGYEQAYSYGSLSPAPTFEVGGAEHSITELYVWQGDLTLGFDRTLPIDYDVDPPLGTVFTLTVGMETFSSADATHTTGTSAYSWPFSLSWSESDEVLVQITIGEPVHYREGTTLEVEGAFSTPPLPETLAFDAEMTVHVGAVLDGYHSTQGSISSNTFAVGGVQYTVRSVGFLKGSANEFELTVTSALPFDSFTLTLGSTELLSGSATVTVHNNGETDYIWSGTNPSWASGATVDVKLDIGLINICDRSPAVAHAIKEATPSFDYCHMTSLLDLDDLTELDIPGGRGTGLKAGDFEGLSGLTRLDLSHYILSLQQLPVGVFDGLGGLTHLDLSHTDLLKLDLGVFDGLDNLEVLDLSDTVPAAANQRARGRLRPPGQPGVLRLSNESPIGGYRTTFSNIGDDFFEGLAVTCGSWTWGPATRSGTRPGPSCP